MSMPSPGVRSRVTSRSRAITPALVGFVCATVYALTAGFASTSGDVTAANVLSWQIGSVGDPTFRTDTYPPLDEQQFRNVWVIQDAAGDEVIGRSPGAVIAAVPAYAALGEESFSRVPGALTAALLTALATALLASCLLRFMPARAAVLASLVFGLTTPVWSVAADGMWPHTVTVLGICGSAWAASRERWWLVGIMGGVAIWGRLHVVVIVAILGLVVGWKRREIGIVGRVALASFAMLASQSLWTTWLYGSWSPMAPYAVSIQGNAFNTEGVGLLNQLGFWVAPDRGILLWTPVVVLMLPALVRHWRDLPDWSTALVWGGIAYTVIQGMRNPFAGGDGFYGYRLTLELLACATPALAVSAVRMGRYARAALGPVLVFQALVISVGAIDNRVVHSGDEVWTTHTFLSALATIPLALVGFLILCVAIGRLAQRIWSSPTVSKRPRNSVPA